MIKFTSAVTLVTSVNSISVTKPDILSAGVDINKVKKEFDLAKKTGSLKQDGFSYVECVTDEMAITGDKHGPNHLSYDSNTPVSIVRYDDVAKGNAAEEGAGMTQRKCFEFCRKIDLMRFFGLVNGETCYCSSIYKQTGGKTEQCNVPCAGDSSQYCGGTTKSSIFEMHDCPEPAPLNATQMGNITALADGLKGKYEQAKLCSDDLAHFGVIVSDAAGKNGNQVAMGHQQDMITSHKQVASQLKGLTVKPLEIASNLKQAIGAYNDMIILHRTPGSEIQRERVRNALSAAKAAAEKIFPAVHKIADTCVVFPEGYLGSGPGPYPGTGPMIGSLPGDTASKFYKSISGSLSASCSGKVLSPIQLVTSTDTCAALCRETVAPESCSGYQVYSDSKTGLFTCIKFSKINAMVKYTKEGCNNLVDGLCYVPVTDTTTFKVVNEETHTIDTCFE